MCDQTPLEYHEGTVVWVKLGSFWWPGEVISFDNLPVDIKTSFQKPPLVSVKFFDEDSFQYIRNLDYIYLYNCNKKYDFIRKGLKVHAAKPSYLEKFRSDICKAETRTGGDLNILDDPKLRPKKKPDIEAIFGTPASHKKLKEPSRGRGRPSLNKSSPSSNSSSKKNSSVIITHPRFTGNDDHVVRELIQSPAKQQYKPEMDFKCQSCDFRASRMEAIVMHHKLHVKGMIITPPKIKKKSPTKKPPKSQRISFTKTSTIDEDIALLSKGVPIFSDSSSTEESDEDIEEEPAPKRKRRGRNPRKKKTVVVDKLKEKPRNIQEDILAEWDDDDDDEKTDNNKTDNDKTDDDKTDDDKTDYTNLSVKKNDKKEIGSGTETEMEEMNTKEMENKKMDEDKVDVTKIDDKIDSNIEDSSKEAESDSKDADNKSKSDSCFDFNEEEEEFGMTIEGRKIPRVLPPVEKRKSLESPKENDLQASFDKVLEECNVPILPEIPQLRSGKFKKSSLRSSSIDSKSSSDQDIEKMIVATKLTNPKKRFAKNFEDETKNSKEKELTMKKVDEKDNDETKRKDNLEVSKLKTQLMQKLLDGPPIKIKEDRKRRSASSTFSNNSESDEEEFREVETKKRGYGRKRRKSMINKHEEDSSTSLDDKEMIQNEEKIESESNVSEEIEEKDEEKDKEKSEQDEKEIDEGGGSLLIGKEVESDDLVIEAPEDEGNVKDGSLSDVKDGGLKDEKINENESLSESLNERLSEPLIESLDESLNEEIIEESLLETSIIETNKSEKVISETSSLLDEKESTNSSQIKITCLKSSPIELKDQDKIEKTIIPESDLVDIEGNFTVVSEKDLADKQVEITAAPETQKPVTLTSFSLDFCEEEVQLPEISSEDEKKLDETSEINDFKKLEEKLDQIEIKKSDENDQVEVCKEEKSDEIVLEPQNIIEEKVEPEEEALKPPIIEEKEIEINVEAKQPEQVEKIVEKEFDVEQFLNEEKNEEIKIDQIEIDKEVTQKEAKSNEISKKESRNPTKLFDILTSEKKTPQKEVKVKVDKNTKIITKKADKPKLILERSEETEKEIHVKKVTAKRSYQDIEDIDTFIIKKPVKKLVTEEVEIKKSSPKPQVTGKPRILQQTIITASGDIIQPGVTQTQEDLYDINSMPIVLDDQILPAETMEMPHILPAESVKQINPIKKPVTTSATSSMKMINKIISSKEAQKLTPIASKGFLGNKKVQKVYQTSSTKLLKPAIITQQGKPGKFIIVPSTSSQPTGTKYTVGKRPAIVKKPPPPHHQKIQISSPMTQPTSTTGNKIMILTDSQGQQQKVLLTPEQQKQLIGPKKRIIQKQILSKDTQIKGANIISQTIVTSKGQVTTTLGSNPITKNVKIEPKLKRPIQQKFLTETTPLKPGPSGQQRTIIIKNPQGQTVKKLQGSNDALLDQQVAEQLQAINRATAKSQLKETQTIKPSPKPHPIKKSYAKKDPVKMQQKMQSVPPLAPISPAKKVEKTTLSNDDKSETKKPQFVIRDGNGALININEGQILALPSEAIDGQPQSYVLVTIDESGNLTPLNSEALMSLDPNLNLGGDLSNTLLQIGQDDEEKINKGGSEIQHQNVLTQSVSQGLSQNVSQNLPQTVTQSLSQNVSSTIQQNLQENINQSLQENIHQDISDDLSQIEQSQNVQAVVNAGDMGQLIITGDPVSAQKFLDSLAEGNTDLANLLANTDGGNVLIQTDGQQILINTDADNSMLLMNQETENIEGSGNPVFSGSSKNQDILAAALADTDVFQQEPPSKPSQLSPNSGLFPINVGNVLETNTMSSPIMTPLEVPSTNSKKIGDESDILDQGTKNVVLPITITDPSISQTASQHQHHQVLENLDLPLAIQDPGILVTSSGMNSPSFVYSLPTLDDSDINQKSFSSSISMPLLTEEEDAKTETLNISESTSISTQEQEIEKMLTSSEEIKSTNQDDEQIENPNKNISTKESSSSSSPCEKTEAYTLRPEMCSSLSEPPPDMFEFAMEERNPTDLDSTSNSVISNSDNTDPDRTTVCSDLSIEESGGGKASPLSSSGASSEIPVQPRLIVNLTADKSFEENGRGGEESFENDEI
ncbi:uro-adherence factor A-like [Onthophagus taurus]|uniref:uro-adherence factor A-like n=1 Tax=Onthophagus taurus TaxID=166361 RepID=UPI0039BDECAE